MQRQQKARATVEGKLVQAEETLEKKSLEFGEKEYFQVRRAGGAAVYRAVVPRRAWRAARGQRSAHEGGGAAACAAVVPA
eukprot:4725626-Prymnesium_polylepis.1